MAMVNVILRATTRHAILTAAIAVILETTWAVRLRAAHVRLVILATVIVISRATMRSAITMAASALITQITWVVGCRALVAGRMLRMGPATLAASMKSAITMAETAAVAHSIVLRALVVRAVRHGAMVGATEIAMLAASTRSANGMVEIAAISPKRVT